MPKNLQSWFNNTVTDNSSEEYVKSMEKNKRFSMITDAYKSSMQKISSDKIKPGFVRIDFLKKEKGETQTDIDKKIAEKLPEHINELLNNNHAPGDIGILVRTNSQSKKVMSMIYDYQTNNPETHKYSVVSSDSAELSKSPSVKIIVSALKYLNNPDDNISAAELIYETQKLKSSSEHEYHKLFSETDKPEKYLPEKFIKRISILKQMHIYELSEELIELFGLKKNKGDLEFIRSLQDIIFSFAQNIGNDLNDFCNWWNEKGKGESLQLSEKQNAVIIQTIHKSKGLAYNHVIIPYADWSLAANTNSTFWAKSDSPVFNGFEYFPLKYKKGLTDTIFRTSYYDHTLHAYTEALNLLYVVFTRAKNSLTVFAPQKAKQNSMTTVADLLYQAISEPAKDSENNKNYIDTSLAYKPETNSYTIGKLSYENLYTPAKTKSFFDEYPGNNGTVKPDISFQSKDFFIESISMVEEKVNYGSLMHNIFAEIETPNDIKPAIEKLHTEGYITNEETNNLYKKIKKIINRPTVSEWFREGLEIITEKAIITEEGLTRIPDRIIINEGKIIVIDFKFGKERDEHNAQILEYKDLLEKIYGKQVKAIIYYAESDFIKENF